VCADKDSGVYSKEVFYKAFLLLLLLASYQDLQSVLKVDKISDIQTKKAMNSDAMIWIETLKERIR